MVIEYLAVQQLRNTLTELDQVLVSLRNFETDYLNDRVKERFFKSLQEWIHIIVVNIKLL